MSIMTHDRKNTKKSHIFKEKKYIIMLAYLWKRETERERERRTYRQKDSNRETATGRERGIYITCRRAQWGTADGCSK